MLIINLVDSKVVFTPDGVVPNDRCISEDCRDKDNYYCLAYGISVDPEFPSVKQRTSPQCLKRKGQLQRCIYSNGEKILGDRQCKGENSICTSHNVCVVAQVKDDYCQLHSFCLDGLICTHEYDRPGIYSCLEARQTSNPDKIIPNEYCTIHAEIPNGNCNDEDNYYCLSFKITNVKGELLTPPPSCRKRVANGWFCPFGTESCLKKHKCVTDGDHYGKCALVYGTYYSRTPIYRPPLLGNPHKRANFHRSNRQPL